MFNHKDIFAYISQARSTILDSKDGPYKIRLFVYSVVACLLLALLYIQISKPVYEISGTISVDKKIYLKQPADSLRKDTVLPGNHKLHILNQLTSKRLIVKAISNLQLQTQYYVKGSFSDTEIDGHKAPVKMKVIKNPASNKEYSVDIINEKSFKLTDGDQSHTYNFKQTITTPDAEFKISKNSAFFNDEKNIVIKVLNINKLADHYSMNIQATPEDLDTSRINLSLTDNDPDKAQKLLTEINRSYKNINIDTASAAKAIQFVNKQLDSINQDLVAYKKKIEFYKYQASGRDKVATSLAAQSSTDIEKQLNILKAFEPYINTSNDQFSFVPNTFGLKDNIILILVNKLNDGQINKQQLLRTEQPGSPLLKRADADLSVLKNVALKEINKQKQQLSGLLHTDKDPGENTGISTQSAKKTLSEISAQQQAKVKLYLYLLQKREDLKLAITTSQPANNNKPLINTERLNRALPALLIALFIGLLLPLPYAYYNYKPKTLKSIAGIEEVLNVPILGNLNSYNRADKIILPFEYDSTIGKQLSWITIKLLNLTKDKKQQVISVTSLNPDEGKSFVSNNVALCLANFDKKVLLINTGYTDDIYDLFKITAGEGLSDYIDSTNQSIKMSIKHTTEPNLHILLAGNQGVDIQTALNSNKFNKLLKNLKAQYDYIVIDTPAIDIGQGLSVLDKYSDILINVVLYNSTPADQLQSLDLEQNNSVYDKLFLVLNNTPVTFS